MNGAARLNIACIASESSTDSPRPPTDQKVRPRRTGLPCMLPVPETDRGVRVDHGWRGRDISRHSAPSEIIPLTYGLCGGGSMDTRRAAERRLVDLCAIEPLCPPLPILGFTLRERSPEADERA
jgi:hypothetical protein